MPGVFAISSSIKVHQVAKYSNIHPLTVPLFSPSLLCPQDRDIRVEGSDGRVQLFTRSEMRDMNKQWTSRGATQRAAEYDVIYDRLQALIVELTNEKNKPQTMKDAVEHVVTNDKVCVKGPGGITMYQYMEKCRAWRKAQQVVAAAAAAEQEQGDVEQEAAAA